MIIRRGITAGWSHWLVLLARHPSVLLLAIGVVPAGWRLRSPSSLLAVSWAWSGEWLLDPRGPEMGQAGPARRSWIRLSGTSTTAR